jgi:hypothetical protein
MRILLSIFFSDLINSVKDLLPIIIVVGFFQIFIIQSVPENFTSIIFGFAIVAFGLAVFIRGLEVGIFPIGENLAHDFAAKGSLVWLLLFAFMLGFSTTIAEPALIAIADKASVISSGQIDAFWLRVTVALSVGCAIALGAYRIVAGHPIHYYIIAGYILVVVVTFFAPKEIIGLAYDSGGVTTSTVTVPLVAALGIGLASSIKGRNPMIDGFGLIAFASLTPMIFVQVFGIVVYSSVGDASVVPIAEASAAEAFVFNPKEIFMELVGVIKDILPILGVIAFFQLLIIKKPIPRLRQTILGIILVVIGLYSFIIGLEMGLFPIGESLALSLTQMNNHSLIYLFGFMIGFATTMAEPALIAIAIKAQEVSKGLVNEKILRLSVAFGVGVGIALGSYRIVSGDPIHYYIIVGYLFVVIFTYLAPRYIIPIAYDSGGVTTSTVTVPLVAALGLGLASNIDGRNPMIDGFGLIAFASLFPMLTVMGYGIYAQKQLNKTTPKESK